MQDILHFQMSKHTNETQTEENKQKNQMTGRDKGMEEPGEEESMEEKGRKTSRNKDIENVHEQSGMHGHIRREKENRILKQL